MKIVVFTYNDPFAGKHGGGTRLLKMVEYFSNYGNVIVIIPTFDEKRPSAMKNGNTTVYYVRMSLLLRIVNFGVLKLTRWFEKPLKIPPAFLHNFFSFIYVDYRVSAVLKRELSDNNVIFQSEFHWAISNAIKSASELSIKHFHTVHDIVTYWYINEKSFVSRVLVQLLYSIERQKYSKIGKLVFISKTDYFIADKIMNLSCVDKLLIPSGVDATFLQLKREMAPAEVLFVGSDHFPNKEAALFIVQNLAEACSTLQFTIIGSVCGAIWKASPVPVNVMLKGVVSDEELLRCYSRATVAVVPLTRGSGMKVKMMEFLGSGIPVISTSIGVEGYDLVNGKNAIIENDLSNYGYWINKLVNDKKFNEQISRNAREYAAKRTWSTMLTLYIKAYQK